MSSPLRVFAYLLSWIPMLIFFGLIATFMLIDLEGSVDAYFVQVVLRSLFIVLAAAFLVQVGVAALLVLIYHLCLPQRLHKGFAHLLQAIDTFPLLLLGVFSMALFLSHMDTRSWIWFLAVIMVVPAMAFWSRHEQGTLHKLKIFATHHQVPFSRRVRILLPFYIAFSVDYFFVALKNALLSVVFVLVVSDYRIMLPKLVDVGLSIRTIIMFFCLFLSLHIVSYREQKL